jgi:hypothetical protein
MMQENRKTWDVRTKSYYRMFPKCMGLPVTYMEKALRVGSRKTGKKE